jgi:hypothetical protein
MRKIPTKNMLRRDGHETDDAGNQRRDGNAPSRSSSTRQVMAPSFMQQKSNECGSD